ncbi:JmjC domain-containing histone demethylation protein 1 [Rhodosporidiobolus nylandii]
MAPSPKKQPPASTAANSGTGRPTRAAVAASPYAPAAASPAKGKGKGTDKGQPAESKKRGRPPKKQSAAGVKRVKVEQDNGGAAQDSEEDEESEDDDGELTPLSDEDEPVAEKKGVEVKKENGHAKGKGKADDAKENVKCPQCKKQGAKNAVWVECDHCQKWYHWACVAPSPDHALERVDKFFCPTCTTPTRHTTLKPPPPLYPSAPVRPSSAASGGSTPLPTRKSERSTRAKHIDYANLDQHLPASAEKWAKVIEARTKAGKIVDGFEAGGEGGGPAFRRMRAEELTDEWVYGEEGFKEPFVVEEPEGLGMKMPPTTTTVRDVAELVGPETPLEVIDVASQSSLNNWNLGQWANYYEDPDREKVRNVISLEVSETELGRRVEAPAVVRKLDWVDTVWPADMKQPGEYPRVQKYCLMSVERCWTDWHVDFAGSSVFYHVLRGGKTFYFIRPTPSNLAAYERWSGSSEKQETTWLGDEVDQVYRMELKPGNTAFIPTGWVHAVYTPSDSLVIGGNFLHSLNIPTQLRIYQIELATKVPRKFRYPHFVRLLWLVAWHYLPLLKAHLPPLPTTPPPPPELSGSAPPSKPSLPPHLGSPRVLAGLKQLSTFLIEQTTRFAKGANVSAERRRLAKANIPEKKISDPVTLSREFRRAVLMALGEDLSRDRESWMGHEAEMPDARDAREQREREEAVAAAAAAVGVTLGSNGTAASKQGLKRRADSLAGSSREGSMAPPPVAQKAKIKHGSFSAPAGQGGGVYAFPSQQQAYGAPSSRPGSGPSISALPPPPGSQHPPPAHQQSQQDAAGSIIGRQTVPLIQSHRVEERVDPYAVHGVGAHPAEVRESRSTQSVVRRWDEDPAGAGGAVVETRTVITIVERVRWLPPGYAGAGGGQHTGAIPSAQQAYQPQGVGPPFAPALPPGAGSTLTPQQHILQSSVNAAAVQNPSPYPAYGYPYHYSLPAQQQPQQQSQQVTTAQVGTQQHPLYAAHAAPQPQAAPVPAPAPSPQQRLTPQEPYSALPLLPLPTSSTTPFSSAAAASPASAQGALTSATPFPPNSYSTAGVYATQPAPAPPPPVQESGQYAVGGAGAYGR